MPKRIALEKRSGDLVEDAMKGCDLIQPKIQMHPTENWWREKILSLLRLVEREAEERGEKKGWEQAHKECDKIVSDMGSWCLVDKIRALSARGPKEPSGDCDRREQDSKP